MARRAGEDMDKEVDWSKARRVTPEEHARFKEALSKPPRIIGRSRKPPGEKFVPVYIRLDPRVLAWAKREAKRARKYASLARKDWKRARRPSEKAGSAETRPDTVVARNTRKPKTRAGAGPRSRRTAPRSPAERTRRSGKAGKGRPKTGQPRTAR